MSSFALVVLIAALLGLTSGHSSSSTPTSTSSSSIPTHTISVGKDGLVFTPNQVKADVGDIIEYRFYPQNHSVARAEWKQPCTPYEYTALNKQGFFSGFHALAVVLNDPPKYQVRVNDTEPIFFYCSSPGACIQDGMVGVVNPTAEKNFITQQEYARNASLMFSPGQIVPEVNPTVTSPTSPSPTSTTTITPEATEDAVSKSAGSSDSPVISTGSIIGISVSGAAVLIAAALLIYLCGRRKTLGELLRSSRPESPPPPLPTPYHDHKSPSMISPTMKYQFQHPHVDIEQSAVVDFAEHHRSDRVVTSPNSQPPISPFGYDQHRDRAPTLPVLDLKLSPSSNPSPGTITPQSVRKPVGEGPRSPTPIYQMFHQPSHVVRAQYPQPREYDPQYGPHELGTGKSTSDRNRANKWMPAGVVHHQDITIHS